MGSNPGAFGALLLLGKDEGEVEVFDPQAEFIGSILVEPSKGIQSSTAEGDDVGFDGITVTESEGLGGFLEGEGLPCRRNRRFSSTVVLAWRDWLSPPMSKMTELPE